MAEPRKPGPLVYSIAAHRGFADALVAGLVPRYREPGLRAGPPYAAGAFQPRRAHPVRSLHPPCRGRRERAVC